MSFENNKFRAFWVDKDATGQIVRGVRDLTLNDLPTGDVVIRARYSSLNFKDALAATATPGIIRTLPHVPGIDVAGVVESSVDPRYAPGDSVIVTGYELGAPRFGGWSQLVRVPADWIVPLPTPLTLRETMILGTAGFTAAQCVLAIESGGVAPSAGDVLVTGATGGVGTIAVKLLAAHGYRVVAMTGKSHEAEKLRQLGAAEVIPREAVADSSGRTLLAGRWGAVVDTVGGETLATVIRQTKNYGVVAACGLVGGSELPLSVHPFILRGVQLAGIASALLPYDRRLKIWERLSGPWKLSDLESLTSVVTLDTLEPAIQTILQGNVSGRTLVDLQT
ncbi:quinone oxidoreductase, YhdH/YhfP family [Pirellula staleyi DSM 6068]|uniref:Quinone oxidoreductase, YhdH/YhfP family n=1 Tax=Pirellula staleyi (strain ATCC 27377 / DSM 6068 / ICPB 4128) TaxID=530564 RepID=D2QY43_PIRSD|nr:acryloyl-CoA reductase [Pirellula staleyi]ADB16257.1 quinone oxidoreductase, YhdH/YhfP family [Pirellula staleyi DSM 6068]